MKKIYFASPLFSEMELAFNESFVKRIREEYPQLEVYLPQEQNANLYTVGLIKLRGEVFSSTQELLEALPAYIMA